MHAVRPVEPPAHGPEGLAWYGVELTFDAPAWAPIDLELVAPDATPDDGAWGHAYEARAWTDGAWADASAASLAGPHRVRIRFGLHDGTPASLRLRHAGALGPAVDLGRAAFAPAPEVTWTPGECAACGDMALVDGEGRCAPCRGTAPCTNHEAIASSARCAACRRPYCAACLQRQRCAGCQAAATPRGRGMAGVAAVKAKLASPADRKKLLLGAIAAFVLAQGGMYAWSAYEAAGPAATVEEHHEQRAGLVLSSAAAFKAQKGRVAKDAAELTAFMAGIGAPKTKVVGPQPPLAPNAVVYAPEGDAFKVFATTAEGQPYEAEAAGRPARPKD